ncbi:BON domain-containing protein [Aliikangiella sp. IMCC44359]|uniref:BON domain-containing protein n=1 Tax=Aliikangiella sp. IMCC44359 TaxID=3459125 RepID=UPI00403A7D0F
MNNSKCITFFTYTIILTLLSLINTTNADTAPDTVADVRHKTQILTTYALSRFLRVHDINVEVKNGKATLTGKVDAVVNKELASQIALSVKGIKKVDNKIKIDKNYVVSVKSKERSFAESVDDATITAAVKSKLMWSKHADDLNSDVETTAGKVTLKGTANNLMAKEMAGRLATSTHDVRALDNQLKIKDKKISKLDEATHSKDGVGQQLADSWITTKVKSTFLYSGNVNSNNISVSTLNGNVTLSGQLGSDVERKLVVELAEQVNGVRQVDADKLKHILPYAEQP